MPKKHILVQSKENTDINKTCKNASQKVNAIARISGYKKSENNNENIHHFAIWLLSFNLDVPQKTSKQQNTFFS